MKGVHLEELEDRENDVVEIAETGGLAPLGVVHAARPVHHDVRTALREARRPRDGASHVGLAVLEEAVEDWAIGAQVVPIELVYKAVHGVGRDALEEVHVFVAVEDAHVRLRRGLRTKDVQVLV